MPAPNNFLDKIEHIVVLMMENRSFDNVVGRLYGPGNAPPRGQTFNGVTDNMSNPRPGGGSAPVYADTNMVVPYPDPNEPYNYVYMQMFNPPNMQGPPCPIPNTTALPGMQGFVIDYARAIAEANTKAKEHGQAPFDVDPGTIMNCFASSSLPVINGLAQAYAVCDYWYSSVPTQTFPNRSFVHAATSSGNVFNNWKTGPDFWDVGIFINDTPTIFNLLEAKKIPWKIYHCGPVLLCNALYGQKKLWDFFFTGDRFFPYTQFLEDVKTPGKLPAYTFIEPNMLCSQKYGPENDMHPAFAILDTGLPTNTLYGDQLIYDIYTALQSSNYWDTTLFIITFDEHGGCFDHQPPPQTLSPDGVVIPANKDCTGPGNSFNFQRLGVRVPSVLVSPWIEQGTICHTPFDHTSVIKTVANKWLGGQSLTKRDAAASDVSEVLSLPSVRTDKPNIVPVTPPVFTGCGGEQLSGLHRDMLAAAAAFVAEKAGKHIDLSLLTTREDIVDTLDDLAASLLAG
jgi:phospholipase C